MDQFNWFCDTACLQYCAFNSDWKFNINLETHKMWSNDTEREQEWTTYSCGRRAREVERKKNMFIFFAPPIHCPTLDINIRILLEHDWHEQYVFWVFIQLYAACSVFIQQQRRRYRQFDSYSDPIALPPSSLLVIKSLVRWARLSCFNVNSHNRIRESEEDDAI